MSKKKRQSPMPRPGEKRQFHHFRRHGTLCVIEPPEVKAIMTNTELSEDDKRVALGRIKVDVGIAVLHPDDTDREVFDRPRGRQIAEGRARQQRNLACKMTPPDAFELVKALRASEHAGWSASWGEEGYRTSHPFHDCRLAAGLLSKAESIAFTRRAQKEQLHAS